MKSTSGPASGARPGRIDAVDGVRAIAFLLVLVYHTAQFAGPTLTTRLPWGARQIALHGSVGVDLFICLSGFCLFLPVVNRAATFSARTFWRKRVRRIVPAYYAAILFAVLLPNLLVVVYRLLGLTAHWQRPPDAWQVVAHLTFVHTLFPQTWDGINGSFWSLGLEAEFYLLMPLLVWLYARYGVRSLAVPVGVSLGWNLVLYAVWPDQHFVVSHFLWGATAFGRWLEFGLGMAGAYVVARRCDIAGRIGPVLGWVGAGGLMIDLLVLEAHAAGPVRIVVLSMSSAAILISASQEVGTIRRLLGWRPLTILGLISYSLYLLHQPTEYYFSQLLHRLKLGELSTWMLELTVGFGIVVVLAAVSYRFFERGYLNDRRHQHNIAAVVDVPAAPTTDDGALRG